MASIGRGLVTEAAFLQRPETMRRVEPVDGEVVEAPTPSWHHRRLVKTLLVDLRTTRNPQSGNWCWSRNEAGRTS